MNGRGADTFSIDTPFSIRSPECLIVNTNAFMRSAFPGYRSHASRMRFILRRRTAAARDARCLGGIRAKSQRAPKARAARCPGSPPEPPTTEPKVRELAERVG